MTNRIFGLSGSGLDVDQLVKEAMKAQRTRYDTLYQKKTKLEWKKTQYNDMYKAINDFRNNTVFNYKLQNTLSPKNASTNNENVAVTAGADAASTNHSLIVTNMAEGVNLTSSAKITTGSSKTTIASQFGLTPGQKFTIKLTNGTSSKEIEVDTNKSIYEFVSDINDAGVNIKANYDTTLDRLFLNTSNTGSNVEIDFSGSSDAGLSFIKDNLKISTTAAPVASVTSTDEIGLNPLKAPLANQFADMAAAGTFDISIEDTVNGNIQTITIDPKTDTMESLMAKINDPAALPSASAIMQYDASTGKVRILSGVAHALKITSPNAEGTTLLTNDLKLPSDIPMIAVSTDNIGLSNTKALDDTLAHQMGMTGSINLNINGKSVTVNATDTVNGLLDKINNMGANATASYNATTGKIEIKATSGILDFSKNGADGLSFLNDKLNLQLANVGQDADITLDGMQFTENSNVFTIAGLTYTLKGESASPITVSVHDDIDKTVENVKKFIDTYNKMLDSVNDAVDDPVYRDYLPLTNDQKAAMKDSEITMWEQRAKSGLLHNDPALQSLAYGMRDILSSNIGGLEGQYKNAASIGITTGGYLEKGKLYLDDAGETKLREALQQDPDIVYKIFGSKSDNASEQGLAVRLYDKLKECTDKIETTAGTTASATYDTQSTLGKEINDYDDRMYDMNKRLKDMEDRYYEQYSALETALYKMNQQSSWLSQQLGGK